jgi:hypothetical protein
MTKSRTVTFSGLADAGKFVQIAILVVLAVITAAGAFLISLHVANIVFTLPRNIRLESLVV